MKRARLVTLCVLALLISAGPAWGSWSSSGASAGSGVAASLSAAAVSVPGSATNTVTVTWSQQASFVPSAPANGLITYILERRLGSGAYAAVSSGACAGAKPFNTTSCLDDPPSNGSYSYRVVASAGSWTATSAGSSAVAVTLSGPSVVSITPLDADPSSAATLRWSVSFSEAVSGVGTQDFALTRGGTLSGGSVTSVTGSGASYTVTASTGTGSGALGLNAVDDDSITDVLSRPLGGPGTGNGNFSGQTYTIDRIAPAVSSIVRAGTNPTNAASVQWTVTFGEPVSGVNAGDFTLVRGGSVTGGAITTVTGSGTTYTVTSSSGTGDGTLELDLADDDTIADTAGNPLGGAGAGNGNFSGQAYSLDRTAPTASSIVTADPNPTNAATVGWTVTFSEAVSGVDAADFALARTGSVSASAAITSVTGSGTTRTVTATTVSGEGTLGLNIVGNGTILDGPGNALSAGVTGQTYTIDRTAPAKTTLQMFDTNGNGKIDRVTATFGETLAASSATAPWTLANAPSGATLASVSTSGTIATLTLTEGAGAADTAVGTFTVALAASATGIRDAAGNQSSFTATAPTDLAAPARTAMTMLDVNANGKIDRVTVAFSETVASPITATAFTLANTPSAGTLASATAATNVVTLAITEGAGTASTAVGSFTVALAAAATGVRDAALNQGSFAAAAPADGAGPVPLAVSDTNGATDGEMATGDTFVASFSEAIAAASLPGSTPITEDGGGTGSVLFTIAGFSGAGLDMGATNYISGKKLVVFAGTSVLSAGNKTITITVGACTSGGTCGAEKAGSGTTMIYVPATTLLDAAGNAAAGSRSTGFKIF